MRGLEEKLPEPSYPLLLHPLSTSLCYTRAIVREAIKKMLLALFAVALVVPAVFVSRPKHADALLGCLIGDAVNKVIGTVQDTGKDIGDAFTSVKVHDATATSAQRETRNETATLKLKECTLDGLVTMLGQTLLQTFTKNIVDWINRGFEGEPAFVTNPEGFLGDVADKVVGQEIKAVAPFLCQPFRLQLQLALGLQYSYKTHEEIRCRLSDVIGNLQNSYQGFVGGDFRQGGWQNWLAIGGTPQNNAYGAYLATTDKLQASIVTATGQQIKLLDWGKGFKSWRKCVVRNEDVTDPLGNVIKGDCVQEGPIQTPGSVIVDQTSNALKAQLDRFQVADEIDEIIGALTNQLLTRAMGGAGGLLGSSQAGAGGVRYIDTLVTDLNAAQQAAENPVLPPEGIDCKLEALYIQSGSSDLAKKDEVWIRSSSGGEPALSITTKSPFSKPATQPWDKYFIQISRGCANVGDRFLSERADVVAGKLGLTDSGTGAQSGTLPPPALFEGNIAQGKEAEESSTWPGENNLRFIPRPENAVDGEKESYQYSATNANKGRQWWRVDLETPQTGLQKHEWTGTTINKINIYSQYDQGAFRNTNAYKVFVTQTEFIDPKNPSVTPVGSSSYALGKGNLTFIKTFEIPINGRYLYIVSDADEVYLTLAEVEVYGTQTQFGSGGNTPANTSLGITVTPESNDRYFKVSDAVGGSPRAGLYQTQTIAKTIKLTPNRDTKNDETVAIAVQLVRVGQDVGTAFSNIFTRPKEEKGFYARVVNNGTTIETPSFVIVRDDENPPTRMNPGLAQQNDVGWVPNTTQTNLLHQKVTSLNSGRNGLNLQSNPIAFPSTLGKYLQYADNPVFIAAGLSLKTAAPLSLTFTGTLAPSLSSDYELRVSVFKEENNTNWETWQKLAPIYPPLMIAPIH